MLYSPTSPSSKKCWGALPAAPQSPAPPVLAAGAVAGSAPSKGQNELHFVLEVKRDFQAEDSVWFVRPEIGLWILTASK